MERRLSCCTAPPQLSRLLPHQCPTGSGPCWVSLGSWRSQEGTAVDVTCSSVCLCPLSLLDLCRWCLPPGVTPEKGLRKDDRNNQSYGKTPGGVITWLRTHQPRRAMVRVCETLRGRRRWMRNDCSRAFSVQKWCHQMKWAGGRWEINKRLVRALWEGSWFDFSQTFALALDVCSVSVLQCKQLTVLWCSALVLRT